jgi:fluoroquinolone resistance protein
VSAGDLLDEAYLADVAVTGAQLAASDAPGFEIMQSRLANVDLSDSSIPRFLVTDVALNKCNLANVRTREFSFRRIAVTGSKWTGIQLTDGTIADAMFTDCRLDLAQFDRVKLTRVAFHGCVLREVDFSNVSFDQVAFVDCDLSRTTFERVRVTASELRTCTLTGMRGIGALRGIAMAWDDVLANAELLAGELGITIIA